MCFGLGVSTACAGKPGSLSKIVPLQSVVRPNCNGQFTGPGARPVSATTVANWYIKDGSLVYLLFLRGDPGWYNHKTEWNYATDSVGQFVQSLAVGDFHYRITLDARSNRVSLLGARIDLGAANIGLVDRVGDSAVVQASELHDFCWASPPDPVAEVLAQSPRSVEFVSHPAGFGRGTVPNTR